MDITQTEFTRWAGRRVPDIDLPLLSAALEQFVSLFLLFDSSPINRKFSNLGTSPLASKMVWTHVQVLEVSSSKGCPSLKFDINFL